MTSYSILVFLHVLGAVGAFAAWGIEAVALGHLRQAATADEARTGTALRAKAVPLGPVAMLTILGTGMWMTSLRWGHQPWTATAFVGLIMIIVIGIVAERSARPRLAAALAEPPEGLPNHLGGASEILAASLSLRVAIGIAILGLMTAKPGSVESVTILAAAVGLSLAMILASRRRRVPATSVQPSPRGRQERSYPITGW